MVTDSTDLKVVNARVVTPDGILAGGVAADDGVVVAVGADRNLPDAERTVDAEGNFLIPGVVDPHVHIGRRDGEYREQLAVDFETETRGAVHGGVTCLLNFVEHGDPYLPHLDFFVDVGEENSFVDFGYHFVLSHDFHLDEIEGLAEAGAPSFKMFFNMYKYTDIDIEPCDADRVLNAMEKIADIPGGLAMFHAENAEVSKECQKAVREEGRHDLQAWSDASPPLSEEMQIEQIGKLSDFTGCHAYVVHISPAEGVDVVERYQDRGVNVSGETLVAFLSHTTEEDLGVWGKVSPPIRPPRHKKRLWEGIRTGVIDHVGTDHVATSKEAVEMGQGQHGEHMWDSPPGIQPSMEYFLPMMMTEGYNENRVGMERLVEVCSTNNAKRFGLYPRKGVIQEGSDADMVIVDPDATAVVDDDFFHTREPRWSSVHGRELRGLPTHTIVGGELAVAEGELLVEPGGKEFLAR
jgi:dihydropyrimidinase/dihydroorotase